MSDIAEFLEARLAEDDEAARNAAGWDPTGSVRAAGAWSREGINSVIDSSRRLVIYGDGPAPASAQTEHIARHDPARVLREVEAKRRILAQEEEARAHYDHVKSSATYPVETSIGHVVALATVIRHLASAYSDHPDYREEWRPA